MIASDVFIKQASDLNARTLVLQDCQFLLRPFRGGRNGGAKTKIGYVRCEATHIGTEWRFEMLSEEPKVAVATIWTADGPVQGGLNRVQATMVYQQLGLFLQDWPEDQAPS